HAALLGNTVQQPREIRHIREIPRLVDDEHRKIELLGVEGVGEARRLAALLAVQSDVVAELLADLHVLCNRENTPRKLTQLRHKQNVHLCSPPLLVHAASRRTQAGHEQQIHACISFFISLFAQASVLISPWSKDTVGIQLIAKAARRTSAST